MIDQKVLIFLSELIRRVPYFVRFSAAEITKKMSSPSSSQRPYCGKIYTKCPNDLNCGQVPN